ncbi:hypothetical protein B0A77_06790 [Flavobacterium branchiophilum]|uniref:Uncharacterized protein n=1 Tax=Flavobacterium branchiophilum TaxID=55197 RepID=A0A2H3KRW0_9FLAO|nr:hypothetical protein B0A77_06790 [Flavobacterium branchiophilum]
MCFLVFLLGLYTSTHRLPHPPPHTLLLVEQAAMLKRMMMAINIFVFMYVKFICYGSFMLSLGDLLVFGSSNLFFYQIYLLAVNISLFFEIIGSFFVFIPLVCSCYTKHLYKIV